MRADRDPAESSRSRRSSRGRGVAVCLLAALLSLSACSAPLKVAPVAPAPAQSSSTTSAATATPLPVPSAATLGSSVATAASIPAAERAFSVNRVLADTRAIARIGVRVGGSAKELAAADYVVGRLASMGYQASIQEFKVPGGVSRNVIAGVPGTDARVLVVSAHLDTRSTTPGANDNALGCAILLEMARHFAVEKPPTSLELTFFGSEEYNDGVPRDHHRGSRYRVAHLTKKQRSNIIGMISIDVVGYGRHLYTRTMGIGPMTMSDYLLRRAAATGVALRYLKDPGPTGWSDHEPYEKAGIPAVWLERLQDPQYHKAGDTTAHLQSSAVRESGRLVLDAIRSLSPAEVRRLARR
jgi:hypothetical protein